METSISTTSGCCSLIRSKTSRPSLASSVTCPALGFLTEGGPVKPDAIVTHAQMDLPIFLAQLNSPGFRLGVAHDIGQGFLAHAETLGFNRRNQSLLQLVGVELDLQPTQGRLAFGVPTQSRLQSQIVQHGRAQV